MLLFNKNTVKETTSGQCSCCNWLCLRNCGSEAGCLLWETQHQVFESWLLLIIFIWAAACALSPRCYGWGLLGEGQVLIVHIPDTYHYSATCYPAGHVVAGKTFLGNNCWTAAQDPVLKIESSQLCFFHSSNWKVHLLFFSAVHKDSVFDVIVSVGKGSET